MNYRYFWIFIWTVVFTVSQYQEKSTLINVTVGEPDLSMFKKKLSFTVSIQNMDARIHICVGSVISPLHVMTVCHCTGAFHSILNFKPFNVSELAIVGGDVSAGKRQVRLIKEMYRHEKCDDLGFGYSHDYGLFVLKDKFVITKSLTMVSLGPNEVDILRDKTLDFTERQTCYVASWGERLHPYTNVKYFTIIRIFEIKLLSLEECEAALCKSPKWRCIHNLRDRMQICGLGKNGDVCRGDSGSPLLCSDSIYGMVAWGPTCGEMAYPSVYSVMYAGLQWSQQYLSKNGTGSAQNIKIIHLIMLCTILKLKLF